MEVEVYVDLLFFINAGMDWLCFGLAGRLLHRRLSRLRMMLGAVLGGLYAVVSLFLEVSAAGALALDAMVCLLMCAIVFTGKVAGKGRFLPSTALYLALSMALGGVMTALYHLLNRLGFPDRLASAEEGAEIWLFALLALVGSALTLWGGRAFRREAAVRSCRVTVTFDGRRVEMEGLVDTGNLLRDPLSGRPVICADRRGLSAILPAPLLDALSNGGAEALTDTDLAARVRIIPAGTVTGQAVLSGFLPDRVEIRYIPARRGGKEVICSADAVVAVAELGKVTALVPPSLL